MYQEAPCRQAAANGGTSLISVLLSSSPWIWFSLAGEVRLDEVELSGNEAVLGGEMRLYWKINEAVLSGNKVVLGAR